MQYLRYSGLYLAIILSLTCLSSNAMAEEAHVAVTASDLQQHEQVAPIEDSLPEYRKINKEIEQQQEQQQKLTKVLPSETTKGAMTKEESIQYLLKNPEEFETILSLALKQGNADVLKELLPYYKQVPNYDPSVLDWGNAIIEAKAGKLDEAIVKYRNINAKLPDIKVLRFQMALALFYNRQFEAAKSEFEKLRSVTTQEGDIKVINNYLEAINEQNSWDFGGSISYVNDHNIANTAKPGTQHTLSNGAVVTYTEPRQSGKGFDFSLYGDKKWLYDNKMFTALHLNSYGNYYWNNKKSNDVTASIGTGIGYQNATTEIELSPFYNKRWYGQGRIGDGKLHKYSDSIGVKLSLNQWFTPNWRYQGLLRHSTTKFIDKFDGSNGKDMLFANTMLYAPNAKQYWAVGIDYSNKKANSEADSYERQGVRFIYGQTWPKGYTTNVNLSAANRYGEINFGERYKDTEYGAGVTLWNRSFSVFTLTPKLNYDYRRVDSNIAFREYDKHNVSVEFTKTF